MEAERAEGIVLRVQPVTETSLLVTWFTREFGKLKTLAKGARRPKSPMRGRVDLFYHDELVFLRSRRSDLHLLQECFLEEAHRGLRANLPAMAAASYACELVDALVAVEDPSAPLFDLLAGLLVMLERRVDVAVLVWFELHALSVAGWRQEFEGETGVERLLRSLANATPASVQRVRLTPVQAREALDVLRRFREQHLGRTLRSERILWQQFEH